MFSHSTNNSCVIIFWNLLSKEPWQSRNKRNLLHFLFKVNFMWREYKTYIKTYLTTFMRAKARACMDACVCACRSKRENYKNPFLFSPRFEQKIMNSNRADLRSMEIWDAVDARDLFQHACVCASYVTLGSDIFVIIIQSERKTKGVSTGRNTRENNALRLPKIFSQQ